VRVRVHLSNSKTHIACACVRRTYSTRPPYVRVLHSAVRECRVTPRRIARRRITRFRMRFFRQCYHPRNKTIKKTESNENASFGICCRSTAGRCSQIECVSNHVDSYTVKNFSFSLANSVNPYSVRIIFQLNRVHGNEIKLLRQLHVLCHRIRETRVRKRSFAARVITTRGTYTGRARDLATPPYRARRCPERRCPTKTIRVLFFRPGDRRRSGGCRFVDKERKLATPPFACPRHLHIVLYEVRPGSKFRFLFLSRRRRYRNHVVISSTRRTNFITTSRLVMYATWSVFKTDNEIGNPATCELRSVIRFLNVSNTKSADVRRRICEVCDRISDEACLAAALFSVHDNARSHTANGNATSSYGFWLGTAWLSFPYSPHLAPGDFRLFFTHEIIPWAARTSTKMTRRKKLLTHTVALAGGIVLWWRSTETSAPSRQVTSNNGGKTVYYFYCMFQYFSVFFLEIYLFLLPNETYFLDVSRMIWRFRVGRSSNSPENRSSFGRDKTWLFSFSRSNDAFAGLTLVHVYGAPVQ